MILSHRHKFIFVKTKKTAGTSVELLLSRHCGPQDIVTPFGAHGRRDPDEELRHPIGGVGPQNFRRPLLVPFGRHAIRLPWSFGREYFNHIGAARLRQSLGGRIWNSYYKFAVVRNPYDRAISLYFWKKIRRSPKVWSKDDLNQFILDTPAEELTNWHIIGDRQGKLLVDHVIRYEELDGSLRQTLQGLGIGDEYQLPSAKAAHRKDRQQYNAVLGIEARARVEQCAHWEFDKFSYAW